MAPEPNPRGDGEPDRAARRDAGLRRVSRITRAAVAGGLAATGAFGALAAHAFSGTTRQATTPATDPSASPTTTTPITPSTTPTLGGSSSSASNQLQAPSTVVQPSNRRGRVTSGGS